MKITHVAHMRFIFAILLICIGTFANAAASDWVRTDQYAARLITAESQITPGMSRLSAGLEVQLAEGWKTYWEFPGEVGLPPELDWSGSTNFKSSQILYPAPTRFTAFEIENFGYGDAVTFPIEIELDQAGVGANLVVFANLLVCADICIPASVDLSLMIEAGKSGPDAKTAPLLAEALSTIPEARELKIPAYASDGILKLRIPSEASGSEFGIFPQDPTSRFAGKPDIVLAPNGDVAEVTITATKEDAVAPEWVTITTPNGAFTAQLAFQETPFPPLQSRSFSTWIWAALFAFIGGLILNIMPCVLPVLSIKFAGVMAARDKSLADIRAGFLASAAGILSFAILLAVCVILLRNLGVSVGMGMQFQSPLFLTTIIAVLVLFATNLFGLFEFRLPQFMTSGMDTASRREGLVGDFLTGAFAALLATPCSAPFLGTAITYAFTGSAWDALSVFLFLGLGLASPYLLAALRPQLVTTLPKPGNWMIWVRSALGVGVAATAIWLTFILSASVGLGPAFAVFALITIGILGWVFAQRTALAMSSIALIALATLAPLVLSPSDAPRNASNVTWIPFDEASITRHISDGKTVFIDVTADWCLTCKANKALVLSNVEIATLLESDQVVAMVADWTRPDETIRAYLEANDRFGIPFNIVYGPDAPEGIALPELLTTGATKTAIETASPSL